MMFVCVGYHTDYNRNSSN